MGQRIGLMQTDAGTNVTYHVGTVSQAPPCVTGGYRLLVAYDTRSDLVKGVARSSVQSGMFGAERLCTKCFTDEERKAFRLLT